MGLHMTRYHFEGLAPTEPEIRSALKALVRRPSIDAIEIDGQTVDVLSKLDGITDTYVNAVLAALGGVPIDLVTGQTRPLNLPSFVDRPWHHHSLLTRLKIRFGYHYALSGLGRR
ncbi:MAG: hypothetical protein H0U74_01145 [Bradymonadaceae bacterium]|nr:hypothetical protein [Lujinxingiaceae bacterium]